jgi:hypothetical protein
VVSFTPGPLYPRGNRFRYSPLDRRLCGPQMWSGPRVEEKNLTPAEIRTPAIQPVAIPTDVLKLQTAVETNSKARSFKTDVSVHSTF